MPRWWGGNRGGDSERQRQLVDCMTVTAVFAFPVSNRKKPEGFKLFSRLTGNDMGK